MDLGADEVLITGAAGWLGRGLLHALRNGLRDREGLKEPNRSLKIRALDLPDLEDALPPSSGGVRSMTGNLLDPGDCRKFCDGAGGSVLLHLVGIIHPRRVKDFFTVNLECTRNVLDAAMEAGVRRAVVMSSNSPIGCNPRPDHLFDEEAPYAPYMAYGRSKMLMEEHVRQIQASGRLETAIVRGTWFYGPFQPARQTLFFRMIRDGKAPIVGGGENRRSMSYIDNVVQGLILAAGTPGAAGETYWIADERPYSMNEIVDTVERLLETEFDQTCLHKRLRLPGLASQVAYLVDGVVQGLGYYHSKIHVLSEMNKTIACSVEKAKRDLGYRPTVALEEGMRRSIRWLVEEQGGI